MKIKDFKKIRLPDKPGVYFFLTSARQGLAENNILYIGKATSLRDRVKSYFSKDIINTRGPAILDMVTQSTSIKWQETDSVLEALILEANLIKKYQPKYNTKEKDNKSFNYVCITKDALPKILIVRGRNLKYRAERKFFPGPRTREDEGPDRVKNLSFSSVFGPYTNGGQLKEAMRIVRRIFPYIDEQSSKKNNKEFYKQLGLTPILGINSQKRNFARSFLEEERSDGKGKSLQNFRIEGYDIAHMSGKNMVGVMTIMENGALIKSEYKKFIIKTQIGSPASPSQGGNDTGALEEVLSRRLRHIEWGLPNLIVVDGSTAQINVTKQVLNRYQFKIPVVSVVKDDRHKAKAIMGDEALIKKHKKDILLINSEAHRFAIAFHKQKRNKNFLG
jgi:excinuclease ABC subunit C